MRWKPYTFGGTEYDLSHLHPSTCRYEQPAKDNKPAHVYTVDVIFSHHCFTRKIPNDECPDAALCYSDDRETRLFDYQRYDVSKKLPDIIAGLGKSKCFHTGYDNYLSIQLVDAQGVTVEYDIFFAVTRASKRGALNLYVQSAYVRDEEHANRPRTMRPIGFTIILFNVLNNKPIKVPK